ncbi:hypothetical protein LNP74_15605 [Klebsiella pneumoniae subsp. pneumoniae]|nr:hypothetical protein [Klebsiella pneumoniae subsp. pneumoniae]
MNSRPRPALRQQPPGARRAPVPNWRKKQSEQLDRLSAGAAQSAKTASASGRLKRRWSKHELLAENSENLPPDITAQV